MIRRLSDIIWNQDPLVLPAATSVQAACQKMSERKAGSVLIVDEADRLIGIFTGRDAVCAVLAKNRNASTTTIGEVMTTNPVTMSPELTAIDALRLMWDGGFRHVPLVRGGKILGVVSRSDFRGDEHLRHEDERDLWEHMR